VREHQGALTVALWELFGASLFKSGTASYRHFPSPYQGIAPIPHASKSRLHMHTPAHEVIESLTQPRAWVAPKYLYDDLGCRLFELITRLPEYYPTRTEQVVLEHHAPDISKAIGRDGALIDLGAGNCAKARGLFPVLAPRQYVAVDVSRRFVSQAVEEMRQAFPGIEMSVVEADLTAGIDLPESLDGSRRTFFYPGSSIGNLDPQAAVALLARIRTMCGHRGGLLVGIDLVKPAETIHAAYNDALGITAAFNRNILNHVNALIGSDFALADWRHLAFYDADKGRVEMHLEADRDLAVSWPEGARSFRAGERIHTESSYKYRLADFTDMLGTAGFREVQAWTDRHGWYAVCHASA
jgi:dimethylhistidine N-methyltransferase